MPGVAVDKATKRRDKCKKKCRAHDGQRRARLNMRKIEFDSPAM
jgi:hypothetical protein